MSDHSSDSESEYEEPSLESQNEFDSNSEYEETFLKSQKRKLQPFTHDRKSYESDSDSEYEEPHLERNQSDSDSEYEKPRLGSKKRKRKPNTRNGKYSKCQRKSVKSNPRTKDMMSDSGSSDIADDGNEQIHFQGIFGKNTLATLRNPFVPFLTDPGNLFNESVDSATENKSGLRPVIIDGNNVAFGHSGGKHFSSRGLEICILYFLRRKHKVHAFVPLHRTCNGQAKDVEILKRLGREGHVIFTPSRWLNGKLIIPYDDRYIIQSATELGGVIVSRDNFRDLMKEYSLWKKTIEERLLMYTWVEDMLIFPLDPLGRKGPSLETFLKF